MKEIGDSILGGVDSQASKEKREQIGLDKPHTVEDAPEERARSMSCLR